MIEVDRLSKRYGLVHAVDRVSFGVGRGEIVGLLGPNGAGKSTTMRMLTTYLPPTSGRARLAGFDVLDDALDVRRHVGYLPENVPLYGEMRVREYLLFRAKLKDVPRSRRAVAIDDVVERCRIEEVEDRIVGQLSRGYRQRVGLAEALLRDPDILILDEPTSGLDPLQVREVRSLLRELGDRHTLLISTHIMSEVEAVCGRVIIIASGRIALDDRLDRLKADPKIVVEAHGPAEAVRGALASEPTVASVRILARDDDRVTLELTPRDGADAREAAAARIVRCGWGLLRLEQRRATLEDRFVQAVSAAALAAEGDSDTGGEHTPNSAELEAV